MARLAASEHVFAQLWQTTPAKGEGRMRFSQGMYLRTSPLIGTMLEIATLVAFLTLIAVSAASAP